MKMILAIVLLLMGICASAQSLPDSDQVEQLIRDGNFQDAKVALQQVLVVKPNSPKANYYMAQIVKKEGGDNSVYLAAFKPYQDKLVAEQERRAAEERRATGEFFKMLGFIILTIIIFCIAGVTIPQYLSNRKEMKMQKEKEQLRFDEAEKERRALLKESMDINEKLLANQFKDSIAASEHRENALDVIEVLSKNDGIKLNDVKNWLYDVKIFLRNEGALS